MTQAVLSPNSDSAFPATPRVQSVGTGFMPVIYHPNRPGPDYVRFERFPRKVKLSPEDALRHAEHVIHYRQIKKAALRRRHELMESPYFLQAAE